MKYGGGISRCYIFPVGGGGGTRPASYFLGKSKDPNTPPFFLFLPLRKMEGGALARCRQPRSMKGPDGHLRARVLPSHLFECRVHVKVGKRSCRGGAVCCLVVPAEAGRRVLGGPGVQTWALPLFPREVTGGTRARGARQPSFCLKTRAKPGATDQREPSTH